MQIENPGHTAEAAQVPGGQLIVFWARNSTQIGIRVDQERGPDNLVRSVVALSMHYRERTGQPCLFDLTVLRPASIVLAMPEARLVLSHEQKHIRPGRQSQEWVPGVIGVDRDTVALCVASESHEKFVRLANGELFPNWPFTGDPVWFTAWKIMQRIGDEDHVIFPFDLSKQPEPTS